MRSVVAFVVMGVTSSQHGVFCRDCGLAAFRKRMNQTLLTGWWGVVHFFINLGVILGNLSARSRLMRLGPPTRNPAAQFLDPGRPVFLRAGFIVSAAVAVILITVFAIVANTPQTPFSHSDQAYVGTCAQESPTDWQAVDCTAPHIGKVVSLAHDASGCPSQDTAAKLGDGNYTCIDTTQ